jgi:hypothetical protein
VPSALFALSAKKSSRLPTPLADETNATLWYNS